MLLLSVFVPFFWGLLILLLPEWKARKSLIAVTALGLVTSAVLGLVNAFRYQFQEIRL